MNDLSLLRDLGASLDLRPFQRSMGATGSDVAVRDLLIEGLLKVRNKTRGLIRLKPNRAQLEFSRKHRKRSIVLKARQLGITTYVAARFFIQTITQPGTVTVQVAHDQESAEEIFKIVHRFWENLPKGMQDGALVTSRANIRQIVFPRLDSEYRVATAADANAGRGMTIHNLHCSEVARWPRDVEETLASLRTAVPEDGEIVIESTPNGAGGIFYEEWQRAEETGYVRHFFPWWYGDEYRVKKVTVLDAPSAEEEQLMQQAGLTEAQIAWRRTKRAQLRGLAVQEYAEDAATCFKASGECVFDLEAIERALQTCSDPVEARDNQHLLIWLPPQPGKQYLIGVDPAGGGSEGDYSCAVVIERSTGLQCAELHGHFPPRELASRLVELANRYNEGLLVVEQNNHGHAVLAHLRMEGCTNVYRDGGHDGWLTSAVSRPAMIENLAAVLAAEQTIFHSPRLLNECRTFVRHPDGNSSAAAGSHDDCVMAMAIALAARQKLAGEVWRGRFAMASLPRLAETTAAALAVRGEVPTSDCGS
jgi:Terminase RNaseH-like domain